jgi:glycosyltransferase involved in cell wall biosynthesis
VNAATAEQLSGTSPLVSVVTPFYNTADYLDECIRSVRRQSFTDWEYLLVDNCSTDDSYEIAMRHQREDARIRVVKCTEFLGQLDNYSRALTMISDRSRFCKVVQADDLIFPTCLERMVDVALRFPRVGLVSAYALFGSRVYLYGLDLRDETLAGADAARLFLRDGLYLFGTQTSVLMRADLVRRKRPFYNAASPFADVEVCLDLLAESDFGFAHQVLTFTRRDNESLYSGIRSYDPMALCRVVALHNHGNAFVDPPLLRQLSARARWQLYDFLGECVWRRLGDADLWRYYRRGLEYVGMRLSWPRVMGHAALVLLRRLANPLDTVAALLRKLRARRGAHRK